MRLACTGGWTVEGPRLAEGGALQVYAYVDAAMVGMLDCELRENVLRLRMAYVSPPWRGTAVLRDMLTALRGTCRRIAITRPAYRRPRRRGR